MKRSMFYRIIVILLGVGLAALAIAYIVASDLFVDSFTDIENKNTVQVIDRAGYIINSRIGQLSTQATRWAKSADTEQFAVHHNPSYVTTNLGSPDVLVRESLDYVFIYDAKQQLLVSRHIDLQHPQASFVAVPGTVVSLLNNDSSLLHFSATQPSHSGVVAVHEGLLLLSSQPINDASGATVGTMVLGRYWLASDQEKSATNSHIDDMRYYEVGDQAVAHETDPGATHFGTRSVYHLSEEKSEGFGQINDIYGKPTIISRITENRSISHLGMQNVRRFMFIELGIVAACFLTLATWFYLNITRRLRNLAFQLTDIESIRSRTLRVKVDGDDEIAVVGGAINFMLQGIQHAQEIEEKTGQLEDKVTTRTDELNSQLEEMKRMNDLMINRELKMKELKQENQELRAKLEAKKPPKTKS